jgi:hypothetical protein
MHPFALQGSPTELRLDGLKSCKSESELPMSSIAEISGAAENSKSTMSSREEAIEAVHYCECCGAPGILTPTLKCGHCDDVLKIRCYVYERRGAFYGECLTLNLVSRGATQEEAIRRLQVAMFSYVDVVLQPGKSTKGLIPRRAPFSSWIRYGLHVVQARLSYLFGRPYPLATKSQTSGAGEYRVVHC